MLRIRPYAEETENVRWRRGKRRVCAQQTNWQGAKEGWRRSLRYKHNSPIVSGRKSASQLSVGEKLEVVLVEEKTADVVVAKDSKRGNTIVGSVAYSNVQELIDCLKEGNEYNATVRECSKTSVKVRISRA